MYKRLKNLRKEYKYTKKYVANYLKIKQNKYSKIESGKQKIDINYLIKLASLYNTSIDYLVNQTNKRTKS